MLKIIRDVLLRIQGFRGLVLCRWELADISGEWSAVIFKDWRVQDISSKRGGGGGLIAIQRHVPDDLILPPVW